MDGHEIWSSREFWAFVTRHGYSILAWNEDSRGYVTGGAVIDADQELVATFAIDLDHVADVVFAGV